MSGSTYIPLRPLPTTSGQTGAGAPPPPVAIRLSMLDHIGYAFLCLFLFLMFGRPADFVLASLHLPLVSSSVALLVAVMSGGIIYIFRSQLGLLLTLLCGWFIFVIPFSTFRGGSFSTVFSDWLRAFLCFVLIVAICKQPIQIRKIMRVLAWSLLLTSLLALQLGAVTNGRLHLPVGLLTGPNELAGAIIVGALYWLFNFFDPAASRLYKAISAAALIPMLLVLLKTGSRGSMLSFAVVLVMLFFGLSAGRKMIVAVCGIFIVLLAFLVLPDDLRRRYTTYFSSDGVGDTEADVDSPIGSTDHRLYLLQRSLEFTLTHPVFGVGPAQFATYEDKIARDNGHRKGSWLGCHNTYTQISSETGIPGLIIFLAILVTAWRTTGRIYRESMRLGNAYGASLATTAQALRYVLLAYMVFFLFEHTAYMPFWPTLIGLIAALDLGIRNSRPAPEKGAAAPAEKKLGQKPGRLGPLPAIARAHLRPSQG